MIGINEALLLLKSQGFIKFTIFVLAVIINVILVEPAKTFMGLLVNIFKQMVYIGFAWIVFTPAVTPWLASYLKEYMPTATEEALSQLAFGVIILSAQHILLYINNKTKHNVKNGTK